LARTESQSGSRRGHTRSARLKPRTAHRNVLPATGRCRPCLSITLHTTTVVDRGMTRPGAVSNQGHDDETN